MTMEMITMMMMIHLMQMIAFCIGNNDDEIYIVVVMIDEDLTYRYQK